MDVTLNCGTQIQTKFPKGNLTKGGYGEIVSLSFQQPETEPKEKPWHHFLWHPLFFSPCPSHALEPEQKCAAWWQVRRTIWIMVTGVMMRLKATHGWQHCIDPAPALLRKGTHRFGFVCLFNLNLTHRTKTMCLAQGPAILMPSYFLAGVRSASKLRALLWLPEMPTYPCIVADRLGNWDSEKRHNRKKYLTSCSYSALCCLLN